MKSDAPEQSLDRYYKSVKERGYENLQPLPGEPEIDNLHLSGLVKEGDQLLEAKAPAAKKSPKVDKPKPTSTNPYAQAREKLLEEMTPGDRAEIEKMEKEKRTENHRYQKFVKEIIRLGEKLSETT